MLLDRSVDEVPNRSRPARLSPIRTSADRFVSFDTDSGYGVPLCIGDRRLDRNLAMAPGGFGPRMKKARLIAGLLPGVRKNHRPDFIFLD